MKRGPVETTAEIEAGTTSVGDQKQLNKKFKRQENDCMINNTDSQGQALKEIVPGLKRLHPDLILAQTVSFW